MASDDPRLGAYLRREVAPYSAHYGPILSRARTGSPAPAALTAVTPSTLDELPTAGQLVLRPDADAILRGGSRAFAARLAANRAVGRQAKWGQTYVDAAYKPVHWTLDGDFPVGWSASDLDRLSEMGRQLLDRAGVVPTDVLVSLVAAGPTVAFWELVFGARRGGLSAIHLDPATDAERVRSLWPNVMAGSAADLRRVATGVSLDGVRVMIVAGEPPDEAVRAELRAALPHRDATVLFAWSPAGTRSLWAECTPGGGLHLDADADVVESVDGELVWSALGWHGTVVLRLRTGVAADIVSGPCPACGSRGARLRGVAPPPPPWARDTSDPAVRALAADARIAAFHLDRDDGDLVVHVALPGLSDGEIATALHEVDARVGATQYVVRDAEEVVALATADEPGQLRPRQLA